jgi:hypothetical protein
MTSLLDELYTAKIFQGVEDKPVWSLSKDHGFHVRVHKALRKWGEKNFSW